MLAVQLSDHEVAEALGGEALALFRESGDERGAGWALNVLLGSAAFQVVRFGAYEEADLQALRNLVADPDARLREQAVGTLAGQHDPEVQQVLLKGLEGTGPLPVDRERAIQLLADDDHLDNLPWLKELYDGGSDDARQEAVRLMGSYREAAETLETIFRDKDESSEVRQQSAASLRHLAPDRFEAVAKEIASDTTDHPGVRETSAHALEHLPRGPDEPA